MKSKFRIDQKELFKNAKFLAAWLALFLLIYYGTTAVFGWQALEALTASTAAGVLKSFGVSQVSVNYSAMPVLMIVEGKQILISELCTGFLEALLLATAVLASFGIALRKRVYGAIGAVIFGFAFNQLRIFVSIMQVLNTDLKVAELTHDFFFRLSLLIVIAGYYYWWFKRAVANKRFK